MCRIYSDFMLAFTPDEAWGHCTSCGIWSYTLRGNKESKIRLCSHCFQEQMHPYNLSLIEKERERVRLASTTVTQRWYGWVEDVKGNTFTAQTIDPLQPNDIKIQEVYTYIAVPQSQHELIQKGVYFVWNVFADKHNSFKFANLEQEKPVPKEEQAQLFCRAVGYC